MRVIKIKIKRFLNPKAIVRALTTLAILYLGLITVYFFLSALSSALAMDTYAANGTFQLYNPLRRLMQGEVIGKDFPFFHGVGVPLLHFPAFHLLGHNVFAADASKWLMSPLVFLITSFIFFLAYFRKFTYSIIATAIFTILSLVCIDVVWPGNSLVGIRTTFPILIAAYMIWHPTWQLNVKKVRIQLYWPILYILIGLAVACGTEQGIAVVVAYMLVRLVQHIRSKRLLKRWLPYYMFEGIYLALVVYIVLSILTLGHANEALRYALIDIPKDQGWYFGAPPNGYLAWNTLWYIFDKPVRIYMWPVMMLGALFWIVAYRAKLVSSSHTIAFAFLVLYGIIVFSASALGYWAPNAQLIPLTRVFGIILIATTLQIIMTHIMRSNTLKRDYCRDIALALCVVLLVSLGWYSITTYKQVRVFDPIHVLRETKAARHSPDGTYASPSWKHRINAFAPYIPQEATIWSTYTGIYDSMRSQLNGSTNGEDYIIHALGPDRRNQYTSDFLKQKPDYAITLRPTYFPYEEWLWIRHWDFYDQLFENYTVIKDNGSHILWKRNDTIKTIDRSKQNAFRPQQDGSYELNIEPSDHVRLYEATVSYSITRSLPVGDKLSRYVLSVDTPSIQRLDISLPSYESQWTFPVVIKPGQAKFNLSPHTHGLIYGDGLIIKNILYREVPLSHANSYPFYDAYCSYGGPLPHGISCSDGRLGLSYYQNTSEVSTFVRDKE